MEGGRKGEEEEEERERKKEDLMEVSGAKKGQPPGIQRSIHTLIDIN